MTKKFEIKVTVLKGRETASMTWETEAENEQDLFDEVAGFINLNDAKYIALDITRQWEHRI